jgi:predicted GNAT family acetyltransferase
MDAPVRHDEAASRFVVETPDGPAFAAYQRARGFLVFTHTEVPEAQEGQGVGNRLAEAALDWARKQGEPVMPLCPFIAAYIRRHPKYRDLVMRGFAL